MNSNEIKQSLEESFMFQRLSEGWSDALYEMLLEHLEMLNGYGLDIYLRSDEAKYQLCVGRKENGSKASSIFIMYQLKKDSINFKLNVKSDKSESSSGSIEISNKVVETFKINEFLEKYPIRRAAFLPNDYPVILSDSILKLISCLLEYKDRSDWYHNYIKTVALLNDCKKDETLINDKVNSLIWYERDNGIASLQQGSLSQSEYQNNQSILKKLLKSILKGVTHEKYKQSLEQLEGLKLNGAVRVHHKALLNRLFSCLEPKLFTTLTTDQSLEVVCKYFHKHFDFDYDSKSNWFEKNQQLKKFINKNIGSSYNEYFINIALWNLFEVIGEKNSKSGNQSLSPRKVTRSYIEQVEVTLREEKLERDFVTWLSQNQAKYTNVKSQSKDLDGKFIRDVTFLNHGKKVISELKFKGSATEDIEAAIGQLLRYGFFPGTDEIEELWIVGGNEPTLNEIQWFKNIETIFTDKIKLKYFYQSKGLIEFLKVN